VTPERFDRVARDARLAASGLDTLRPLASRPAPITRTPAVVGSTGNVDRLVTLVGELLEMFGAGGFKTMAESEIRNNVTEESGRAALERIHRSTRPPYR